MATPQQVQTGSKCLQFLNDKLAAVIYLLNTGNLTPNQIHDGAKCYEYIEDKLAAIIYLLNTNGDSVQTIQTNAACYEFLVDYRAAFVFSLNDDSKTAEQIEEGDKCLQYLNGKLACIIYLLNTNNLTPQQIATNSKCYSYLENKWAAIVATANSAVVPPPQNGLLNGLASYWKLDETAPSLIWADSIGPNPLVDVAMTIVNDTGPGVFPSAAKCVPVLASDRLFFNGVNGLVGDSDFSFSGWFKLSDLTDNQRPFQFVDTGNTADVILMFMSGGDLFVGTDSDQAAVPVSLNTFFHLAVVNDFNGTGNMSVYKNAVLIDSFPAGSIDATNGNISFFNLISADNAMASSAAQAGWWNRLFSQTDVTNLFNGSAGLPLSSFTT